MHNISDTFFQIRPERRSTYPVATPLYRIWYLGEMSAFQLSANIWPRPFPGRNLPLPEMPPEANPPFLQKDHVGFSFTPLDTVPVHGRRPELLDAIDFPEILHPTYRRPRYLENFQNRGAL